MSFLTSHLYNASIIFITMTQEDYYSNHVKWIDLDFKKDPNTESSLRFFFFPHLFIFYFLFLFVVNFVIHWNETAMGLHVFPIPIPPPTSLSTLSP